MDTNQNKQSLYDPDKGKLLIEIAHEIPKYSEYALDRIFKLKKSFYTILEISVVWYIHFDIMLVSNDMGQYRKVFIKALYSACEDMGKSMGKKLTTTYFDSLIEELALIVKNDKLLDIYEFPMRLLATSKKDSPYNASLMWSVAGDFLMTTGIVIVLSEYLSIVLNEVNKTLKKLQSNIYMFFDGLPRNKNGGVNIDSLSEEQIKQCEKYMNSVPKDKDGMVDYESMTLEEILQSIEFLHGKEHVIKTAQECIKDNNEQIEQLRTKAKGLSLMEKDKIQDEIDALEEENGICEMYIMKRRHNNIKPQNAKISHNKKRQTPNPPDNNNERQKKQGKQWNVVFLVFFFIVVIILVTYAISVLIDNNK